MDCGVAWTWRNAVNRERWEKIKDLFGSTVELDPSQRSAFLRDACGSDEALRAEVESLLASYQRTEALDEHQPPQPYGQKLMFVEGDRKSTRLNSSHANISYAVFCLKKKTQKKKKR